VIPAEPLRQTLSNLDSLPAIPDIARKILSLKLGTAEGERALIELIEKDPPTMTRIISLCNTPLFGTGPKITKLNDAVALLGSKRVKMIALSFSIISSMIRKPAGLLNIQSLWRHSLAVTITMETLARCMHQDRRPPDDEIYLAGLLHDIGFLVLDYLDPQLSDKFHARLAVEPNSTMEEIEAEMLEMDHGQLGALLGRHWNLPEPIIASLKYHHAPDNEKAAVGRHLVTLANLAEKMLPTFGFAESTLKDIPDEEWQSMGIEPDCVDEIKAKVQNIVLVVTTTKF